MKLNGAERRALVAEAEEPLFYEPPDLWCPEYPEGPDSYEVWPNPPRPDAALLAWGNALLRAAGAHGQGWCWTEPGYDYDAAGYRLNLWCGDCDAFVGAGFVPFWEATRDRLTHETREAITGCPLDNCEHLRAIPSWDEVEEIAALELLAGDAP